MKLLTFFFLSLLPITTVFGQQYSSDARTVPICKIESVTKPAEGNAFITVPSGTVITLMGENTRTVCKLAQDVFPLIVNRNGRVTASDIGNGQRVFTDIGTSFLLVLSK